MPKGYNVTISKKRYSEIIQTLHENIKDEHIVETIEKRIQEILEYDPSKSTYNPDYGKKELEKRRQRALEEGKSIYELYRKPYMNKATQ